MGISPICKAWYCITFIQKNVMVELKWKVLSKYILKYLSNDNLIISLLSLWLNIIGFL